MQVVKVQSTLVSLVKFDVIPIVQLITSTELLDEIGKRYSFKQGEIGENGGRPSLVFGLGVFERDEAFFPILKLAIEERKIICVMESGKDIIDAFYNDVIDFLMQVTSIEEHKVFNPIIVSNESEIIVQLDVNVTSLFSDKLLGYFENEVVSELDFGSAAARIKPMSVRFDVEYFSDDLSLQDYRINLVRKELFLQLRPGYSQQDRMFVSKMPVDSNTHIRLLIELEKVLKE